MKVVQIILAENRNTLSILQAVVGSNVNFLDVAAGFPGTIHDARMLQAAKLYQDADTNMILNKPTDVIENKEVHPLLISDGAYQATS